MDHGSTAVALPADRPGLRSARHAVALVVLGVLAFVLMAAQGLHSLQLVSEQTDARKRARQNLLLIQQNLLLLVDLETGQRGFVLTGEEKALQPYFRALEQLQSTYPELVRRLNTETAGRFGSDQQPRLDALIDKRISLAVANVEARKLTGPAWAGDIGSFVSGRETMDAIRREFAEINAHHERLIDEREAAVRSVQRRALLSTVGLLASGVLLVLGAVWLGAAERRMRDEADAALRRLNRSLECTVQERTSDLREALARIQTFAGELDCNIETERRRLAREVHDQFGQIATGMKMVVIGLFKDNLQLPRSALAPLTSLLDEAVAMARRIASELRPPLLDDLGFEAAVSHFAQTMARTPGLLVDVDIRDDHQLTPTQANQLFRILQEAATNVLRHADARLMQVIGRMEGGHYLLEVLDDGVGPQTLRAGASGVRNMKERAALAGGELSFGVAEPKGTRVAVRIPLAAGSASVVEAPARDDLGTSHHAGTGDTGDTGLAEVAESTEADGACVTGGRRA